MFGSGLVLLLLRLSCRLSLCGALRKASLLVFFCGGGLLRRLFQRLLAFHGREHAPFRLGVEGAEGGVEFLVIFGRAVFALEVGAQRLVAEGGEYAGVALAVEIAEDLVVLAVETQPAVLAEEGYPVALVEVLHRVRDDDYRAAFAREFFQEVHHLEVEVGREPAGRLVEEDDLGVGEQLHRDGHALSLPAGEG